MPSGGTAFLLLLFANAFTPTDQSWWLSDKEFVYNVDHEGADIYDVHTRETTRFYFSSSINESSTISYSRDLKYTAEFIDLHVTSLYPDRTETTVVIHDNSEDIQYQVGPSSGYEIDTFEWSHGSAYACSYDNDIYYVPSPGESPIRVTYTNDDTRELTRKLPHTRPDAEIIDIDDEEYYSGMWFSPSDKYLAHASKFENSTGSVTMTSYNRAEQYDYQYDIDHPRPGLASEPAWTVSIFSVEDQKSIELVFPMEANSSVTDLVSASWVVLHGEELLVVTWANRWYNETAITLCSYEKASCSLLFHHKYAHAQWAYQIDYSSMVHSDSALFFILPEPTQDNAWQHIAKLEISTDYRFASISFLASGEYDIRKILAYRPIERVVVFDAQAPNPWNRHVYAAPVGVGSSLQEPQCLTCVTSSCAFQQEAAVSRGEDLHIGLSCDGPLPSHNVMIYLNTTLHPEEMQNITEADMEDVELPKWTTDIFNLSSGYEAIVRIYEGPSDLPSVAVTLMVYGGPEDNQVLDEYQAPLSLVYTNIIIDYEHAIVNIDVRGSGGRGWKYRSAMYSRMLSVEVEDTIEAMEIVLAKYPKLDKNRVGVYGWSYGGSMTTALVERAPQGFFKCAVAGAGVMNVYNYAAWYADRYMGDAPRSAYVDLTEDVTAFEHTKLLVVHGLRDDNVLFRHSALLIEALQEANISFELMVYPNDDHNVGNAHWDQVLKIFLSACYEPSDDESSE